MGDKPTICGKSTEGGPNPTEEELARRMSARGTPPPALDANGSAAKGSRTDSPIGRNSPAHSPLSRWLPSFRQPRSPRVGSGAPVPPIHVNLFDDKFVSADS